jgi:hypothetical protein
MRRPIAYLTLLFALCACEKIDFSEETGSGEDVPENLTFLGTGKGTLEAPFTVEDVLKGISEESSEGFWVIGYAVGATYSSIKNAELKAYTFYDSNILLAADSTCKDYQACIPVELNTKALKEQFALPSHPERYRQCLLIKGFPAMYFKVNGIRRPSTGHWLGRFDISSISAEPEAWTQDTIPMR